MLTNRPNRQSGDREIYYSEYNCRGGPPWPPVFRILPVASNGRPRRAAPTVVSLSAQSFVVLFFMVLLLAPVSAQPKRKARPQQNQANAEAEFERFVKQADEARLAERFDDAITLY